MKARIASNGTLELARDARGAILRLPTTNLPDGVALSRDAKRAYVSSELVGQVTVLDLERDEVVHTIDTAETPAEPSVRRALHGKLAFFTGMGVPAGVDPIFDPRDVDTHRHRNMASDNNWSSCASCHPDGLADGVTWLFPTGPRQTIALDAFFAPGSTVASNLASTDQKMSNWNAVRGSITDFNNNARNIQGGHGFTPQALATIDAGLEPSQVPDASLVFNQGPRLGVSSALDLMTEWVATVRTFDRPTGLNRFRAAEGRVLFAQNCASCHGGTKWTRSQRVLTDLVRWPDPAFAAGAPLTPNLLNPAASIIAGFDSNDDGLFDLPIVEQSVGSLTLDLANPIEIRGAGGLIGQASVGAAGSFNAPSLFGAAHTAPYGHHGRAQTLEAVFTDISSEGLGHPDFGLTATELENVLEFVRSIDAQEPVIQ